MPGTERFPTTHPMKKKSTKTWSLDMEGGPTQPISNQGHTTYLPETTDDPTPPRTPSTSHRMDNGLLNPHLHRHQGQ